MAREERLFHPHPLLPVFGIVKQVELTVIACALDYRLNINSQIGGGVAGLFGQIAHGGDLGFQLFVHGQIEHVLASSLRAKLPIGLFRRLLDRFQDGIRRDGAGGLDRFHSQTLSDCRNVFKLGADPFLREVLVTGYGVEENPGGQSGLQVLIVVRANPAQR